MKKQIITGVFSLLILGGLQAQNGTVASGGEATGTGGTTSYSVGQMAYTTNTGTNGTVSQGVQQVYSISSVGISESSINMELSIYPNPTTDFLTLKVEEVANLHYQLIDMQGKLIESKAVNSSSSSISLENQANATYFLKVTKNNQLVKTFKIVKQ